VFFKGALRRFPIPAGSGAVALLVANLRQAWPEMNGSEVLLWQNRCADAVELIGVDSDAALARACCQCAARGQAVVRFQVHEPPAGGFGHDFRIALTASEFLCSLRLSEYETQLAALGGTSVEHLMQLVDADLDAVGMKVLHRRSLCRGLRALGWGCDDQDEHVTEAH
jgi:hypothetical protein